MADQNQEIIENFFNAVRQQMTASQAEALRSALKTLNPLSAEAGKLTSIIRQTNNNFDYLTDSIAGSNQHMRVFNAVLRKGAYAQSENIREFENSSKNLVRAVGSSLNTFGQESSESSVHIKNAADITAKAIGLFGSALSLIPLPGFLSFGKGVKETAEKGAEVIKILASQMEGIRNAQRQFYESGVQFSTGIDGAYKLIKNSNYLTLNDLAVAASQARDDLRLMGGGVAASMENIVEAVNIMGKTNSKYGKTQLQLATSLGYSNQEIMTAMAEIASARDQFGDVPAMTSQELSEATLPYLQNMRELERLTGIDAKTRKSNVDNMRAELGFQNALLKYPPKQREMIEKFTASLNPAVATIAKFTLAGKPLPAQFQLLANQFPELQPALREAIESGVTDPNQMVEILTKKLGPDFGKRLESVIAGPLGEVALYSSQLSGSVGSLVTDLGSVISWFQGLDKQIKASGKIDLEKQQTNVQDSIDTYIKTSSRMANAMNDLAFELTVFALPALDKFSEGLISVIDEVKNVLQPSLSESKIKSNIAPVEGEIATTSRKGVPFTSTFIPKDEKEFEALAEKLNDTPAKLKARYLALEKALKIVEQLGENSIDVRKMEPMKIQGFGEITPTHAEYILKLLTENKKFYEEFAKSKIQINGMSIGKQKEVPGLKLGDIFNPKPGGHVIRVAEAFQPELVAPAKRDPQTGQMGLVVSGAMLDNSSLLKDLAVTNKTSQEILASLNTRMFELGRSMERLVEAQREANRLAV